MRKRLYALLGCLLAAAVIGGCSGSSDTQTSGSGQRARKRLRRSLPRRAERSSGT